MTAGIVQANIFDYAALDTETKGKVRGLEVQIDELEGSWADVTIRLGGKYAEMRDLLRYSKAGGFDGWIKARRRSRSTVYNLISVHEVFGKCPTVGHLDLAPKIWYMLASPSTPEPARLEVLERAEAGEPITYTKARQITNEYKPIGELLETANDAVIAHSQPMADPDELITIEQTISEYEARDKLYSPRPGPMPDLSLEEAPDYSGDEWYTPREYIAAARDVLGTIDLDPASCLPAQTIVGARRIYTVDDDGLEQPWTGRVWLNPPYSMPLIQKFVRRLIDHYEAGDVTAAIVLTNNCTDAGWFHSLLEAYPVCFTRGRIPFWRPNQTTFATRQGQAFFYLGTDPQRFVDAFSQFGIVVTRLP